MTTATIALTIERFGDARPPMWKTCARCHICYGKHSGPRCPDELDPPRKRQAALAKKAAAKKRRRA